MSCVAGVMSTLTCTLETSVCTIDGTTPSRVVGWIVADEGKAADDGSSGASKVSEITSTTELEKVVTELDI